MAPIIKESTQPHIVKAADSMKGQPSRDRGLIARLGWDLSDLNRAVYHSSSTAGSSLLVGEMLAGPSR